MSKEINNREYRQQILKDLLAQLHQGKRAEDVKAQFERAFSGVDTAEIAEAEQMLIAGGMPVEEVQRLCDVHAAVFKDLLTQEESASGSGYGIGHPCRALLEENRTLERVIRAELTPALDAYAAKPSPDALHNLRGALGRLAQIDAHYLRKENLLFPYLEKHGITAPPKVMWGVDDEIRALIKSARQLAEESAPDAAHLREAIDQATAKAMEMIFKEENILLPLLMETLTPEEWQRVAEESGGIGFSWIPAPPSFRAGNDTAGTVRAATAPAGNIALPTGTLALAELIGMLDTLPLDITFVDKDDTVKYFSQGAERIFPRTTAVIGRKVVNCHPPASMHIVEGILRDFQSGAKNHEDFWIRMGGKLIYIRYFAVRSPEGAYLGTLEVTQNIAPIQALDGEKRLVSDA